MLGHDDVAEKVDLVLLPCGFQEVFEDTGGAWGGEVRVAVVTTEGDEVEIPGLLASFETWGHEKPR